MELAAREHGLDLLTCSQTKGLGNSPGADTTAHDPPARNPRPSSRPGRTRCAGTGTKLPHKWPFPTRENTQGGVQPTGHSSTEHTLLSTVGGSGRRPADPEKMTSAPRGPTARPPRTTNGHSQHFGTRYPTQSTARGPRSSPGSASPGTRQECSRAAPHGPRAGQ